MDKNEVKAVLDEQMEDIKKSSKISSLILSCCMIDTLAGFYNGYEGQPKKNKAFFLAFVKKYLSTYNADNLYKLRCDVVHSFSNSLSYLLVDSPDFSKAFPNVQNIFGDEVFKIDKLKQELEAALNSYFLELVTDSNLLVNFNKRLNHLGILTKSVIPTLTDLQGNIVSRYQDLPEMPGIGIKYAVFNPTHINK